MDIAHSHNLKVIEDAAQAFGADYKGKKICTLGDIACVSFYPSKNLGAYGDGGLIVSNDNDLAANVRSICNHGQVRAYYHDRIGVNSRLDAIQASILRVKLRYLDEWNTARRHSAKIYDEVFSSTMVVPPFHIEDAKHIYHQYIVRSRFVMLLPVI